MTVAAPVLPANKPAAIPCAIEYSLVDHQSVVTRLRSGSPLKLLVPKHRDLSAWVIASNFGGGMLAGDTIELSLTCRAGSRGLLGTQSSSKVYRSPSGRVSRFNLNASIEDGALLAVLPDAVSCFTDARYEQRQRFDLAPTASLLLLDWFTCGRLARGERWAFDRYHSRNEIFIGSVGGDSIGGPVAGSVGGALAGPFGAAPNGPTAGRRVVDDALNLDRAAGPIDAPFRLGRFNCMASAFIIGPAFATDAAAVLANVRARKLERTGDLLIVASPIADHGTVVRIAGVNMELVGQTIRELLAFVATPLGENPWSRKW